MSAAYDPKDCPLPADYICRKFNLSRTTLWRWRRAGLPAQSVGAKLFVRERDVIEFIARMSGTTVSAAPSKQGSPRRA